jgi:hypothetical protein
MRAYDHALLRRLAITALFSDDELAQRLVLKGGNALSVIYGADSRVSLDIDCSIAGAIEDLEAYRLRFERALVGRFRDKGYLAFDVQLEERPEPTSHLPEWWGGYELRFKVIAEDVADKWGLQNLDRLRMAAIPIEPPGRGVPGTWTVDISRSEYCEATADVVIDNFDVVVYTLPAIVVEKLRALCQQHPDYPWGSHKKPRPRDAFDIHTIFERHALGPGPLLVKPAVACLVDPIFGAKRVNPDLLARLGDEDVRRFHRSGWSQLHDSIRRAGEPRSFDFYYEWLLAEVDALLKLRRNVDPPI